jgi:hypothetical protein
MIRTITTGYGADALAALRDAVASAKAGEPMASVTVIAPNNIAGIVARRYLATGIAGHPGIAGLEVTTLARLAERIATGLLMPRRPATPMVIAAAWRHARSPMIRAGSATSPTTRRRARSGRGAHRAPRSHPGRLGRGASVDRGGARPDRVARGGGAPARAGLVRRHRAAHHAQAVTDIGATVPYPPQLLTRAEAGFAAALRASSELTVVAGLTGAEYTGSKSRRSTDAALAWRGPAHRLRVDGDGIRS